MLLHSHDNRRALPQFFQAIVIAHRPAEQVRDHAVVIEENPARVRRAFGAERRNVMLFETLAQIIGDCFHLPFIIARRNNQIIGDDCQRSRIEQDNVFALFVGNRIDDIVSQRARFQRIASCRFS